MVRLKIVSSNDGRTFSHRPTGYNTDPTKDRTVYYDGKMICRVTQCPSGAWMSWGDWAGLKGTLHAQSFQSALADIKRLHSLMRLT